MYLFETQLNKLQSVQYSLKKVYGLNSSNSNTICKKLGFSSNLKLYELTEDQLRMLVKFIDNSNLQINSDLKNSNRVFKDNLVKIKSYRGLRRISRLPVRGQRTHTNAKTCKRIG